jgi:hypothetical protein
VDYPIRIINYRSVLSLGRALDIKHPKLSRDNFKEGKKN